MNDVISTGKMPSARGSSVFSGIFPVEMTLMFLIQYRDTKCIFNLIYKITKVFSSVCDVVHVSVLKCKIKMTLRCLYAL